MKYAQNYLCTGDATGKVSRILKKYKIILVSPSILFRLLCYFFKTLGHFENYEAFAS